MVICSSRCIWLLCGLELHAEGRGRTDGVGACRFFLGTWNMKGFLSEERPIRTLREVLQRLRESYCGTIGYEARTCPGSEAGTKQRE